MWQPGTGSLMEGRPDREAVASPVALLVTLVLVVLAQGFEMYMWYAIPLAMVALLIIVYYRARTSKWEIWGA